MKRTVVRIASDVLHRSLGGETVVMNLDSGETFSLDRWGCRTWALIEELGDLRRIEAALESEFEVDPETVRRDVGAFLAELEAKGLIELDERPE